MARKIISGLIQASNPINDESKSVAEIQAAMFEKHLPMIDDAGKKGVQILCLQEIFNGPYFCPARTSAGTTPPSRCPGPTVEKLRADRQEVQHGDGRPALRARDGRRLLQHRRGVDADGTLPRQVPQEPHPADQPGFWEKYFFKPGQPRLSGVPDRVRATIGVYICYDRHFPEGARALGLHGAEIVFNPSATVAGLFAVPVEARAARARGGQRLLRRRDQPRRHRGAVEHRQVLRLSRTSSIRAADFVAQAAEDKDELVVAELDLTMIEEVRRTWQFFRDRRPDSYGDLIEDR